MWETKQTKEKPMGLFLWYASQDKLNETNIYLSLVHFIRDIKCHTHHDYKYHSNCFLNQVH